MKVKAHNDDIVIDELEEEARTYKPMHTPWTEREDVIIRKYYNKVNIQTLARHLPGRSITSIRGRASKLREAR